MKSHRSTLWNLFLLAALGLATAFYLWGIEAIPFHPDESTYLYMSSDLETLFRDPASLAWEAKKQGDLRQHYRAIDAPLTRYLLGVGRLAAGQPANPADWDWSKSWQENQQSGALPDPALLRSGRVMVALLLPLCLLLIYLLGATLGGRYTGLLAAVFLGLNALILLHNRRAMAESALTFGVLLATWCFIRYGRKPWLCGLAMALAFNAKHSALALLPVGLLAVCWTPEPTGIQPRKIAGAVLQYLLAFALLTLALNPYLWRHPLDAVQETLSERQELLKSQLADTARLAPEQALDTPLKRGAVLVANIYITPPAFAEADNYLQETAASQQVYLSMPGHDLLRGLAVGSLLLVLSITGLMVGAIQIWRTSSERRRALVLIMLATGAQFILLALTIPLPWQRYSIPMLPYACLWGAYALGYWLDPVRDSDARGASPIPLKT
jgi:hypothetical protein